METFLSYVWTFVVGGSLCALAQLLIDRTKVTPARILVLYVSAGVVLGALGIYKPLVELAGAGATTPLTGFGYLISKGVREAVDKDGFLGILTGGITAAAGGITAALVFSLAAAMVVRSKPKY